jgi:hypothetical protein
MARALKKPITGIAGCWFSGFTARCIHDVEIVGRVVSAVSGRPTRAAQKLITAKTEMRMMIFTISAP